MSELQKFNEVKKRFASELAGRPGVVGVDVGLKYTGNQLTDKLAIRVFVKQKRQHVSESERIPRELDGLETDVIERKIELIADDNRYDPVEGGVSITIGDNSVGTGGLLVTDNQSEHASPMLLSCQHVLPKLNGAVRQPGTSKTAQADIIGYVKRSALNDRIDAAVCSVRPETTPGDIGRKAACQILNIGTVTSQTKAEIRMPVRKRGRTTGLTTGIVESVDTPTEPWLYPDGIYRSFTGQISIVSPTPFASGGDSGSAVVNQYNQVIGLAFIAWSQNGHWGAYANPIDEVLSQLDVSLCTSHHAVTGVHRIIGAVGHVLFGVTQGGGGIIILPDGRLQPIPPRGPAAELPPELRSVLTGLAISELTALIDDPAARDQIKRAALQMVIERVQEIIPEGLQGKAMK